MPLDGFKQNCCLVLGRAGMDLYADPPGTRTEEARRFTSELGGSAANIAVAIVRLGGAASLLTAVSDDAVGRFVVNELKRYEVGTEHICTVGGEARNSLAVVETRAVDTQSVIYRNGAADFEIDVNAVRAVDYSKFGALIFTGTCLAKEPSRSAAILAIEMARELGLTVILDVDHRPYSWSSAAEAAAAYKGAAARCHIVIGNDDEFGVMAGPGGDGRELARSLASSAEIVIYKMGAQGSVTFTRRETFETGVFPVKALKSTGAGDAFMGGLVSSLAAGRDLRNSVRRGSAAAAIVVTRVGCAPAMPTAAELDHFIATYTPL